ncbi:hypothetical protein ACIGNX_34180 [Actinosynnema sp. NPDC053489]|uniref:hypothetical protein n=1 Tax=Actinosynnema sp. NPDC053489 TaxID=3363916 RepID=UPI0037CB0750
MATGTAEVAPTQLRKAVVGTDAGGRVEAIGKEAKAEPQSVVGLPTGGQVPDDPFASLRGVAGWAVDYVAFLREPIDRLQGDPQGVRATADAIRAAAERMRELAGSQRETLAKPEGWTGKARDAYQTSMEALGDELVVLADAVAVKGVVVENTGAMVQALREAVLYSVGRYSDSLVPGAIQAYAFAPATFGASIAVFLGGVVAGASRLGADIAAKMEDLNAALTRQVDRMKQLDAISDEVARGWERYEAAAGGETATRPMVARRMLAVEEAHAGRATGAAVPESEALRPVAAGRAVEESHALLRTGVVAEEPRHALQGESMVRASRVEAVQAEPMMQAARMESVPAEPMMRASRVEAVTAEPMMQASRVEAMPAEPMMQAARVEAQPLLPTTHLEARHAVQARPLVEYAQPLQPASPVHYTTVHRVEEAE